MARVEVGVVTAHPLVYMLLSIKTIWATWTYARKHRLPCNKWYGVYEAGTEIMLAQTGCLPNAKERAVLYASIHTTLHKERGMEDG